MGHGITQGSSTVAKCLQEKVWDSPHEAEGFQEPDRRTWHRPPTPQVFAQECMVGWIFLLRLSSCLLNFFHIRKHTNVDDTSAAKAAKISEDDIEKAKMEWATLQFSDDEGNEWFFYWSIIVPKCLHKVILPPHSVVYISYTIYIIHFTLFFGHLQGTTAFYKKLQLSMRSYIATIYCYDGLLVLDLVSLFVRTSLYTSHFTHQEKVKFTVDRRLNM